MIELSVDQRKAVMNGYLHGFGGIDESLAAIPSFTIVVWDRFNLKWTRLFTLKAYAYIRELFSRGYVIDNETGELLINGERFNYLVSISDLYNAEPPPWFFDLHNERLRGWWEVNGH